MLYTSSKTAFGTLYHHKLKARPGDKNTHPFFAIKEYPTVVRKSTVSKFPAFGHRLKRSMGPLPCPSCLNDKKSAMIKIIFLKRCQNMVYK